MPARPRRDDATYVLFFVAGMVAALGGGILLGALDRPGPHALLQAGGFLGLIVCGMGLRLAPRLALRPPLPVPLVLAVLGLQVLGVGLLLAGLPWVYVVAGCATCGLLLAALLPPPAGPPGWWAAALCGSLWWAGTALLAATGGGVVRAVVLGVAMSFVWAVQARMVRVFFGRPPTRAVVIAAPLLLWEGGVLAGVLGGAWGWTAAGIGGFALCLVTGAVRGPAHRLTAGAAAAGPAILWANRAGLLASVLLAVGGLLPALTDTAVHLYSLSMASVLIVAMARLLAPVFAVQRATGGAAWDRPAWSLLLLSGALRALYPWLPAAAGWAPAGPLLLAGAGILAWLGLALFAAAMVRAVAGAPSARAELEERARRS